MEQVDKNLKLNLLKFFACISVVFIHLRLPGRAGSIIAAMCEYAVPVFYMIAGYYAFDKGPEVIKRRLLKIVKIFFASYVIFFVYRLMWALKDHYVPAWFAEHFTKKTPIDYLWFCIVDFAVPLWYLIAMAETYLLWLLIVKKGKEQFMMKLLIPLFIIQTVLITCIKTMNLNWIWNMNFITRALVWFLFGYYLHTEKSQRMRNLRTGTLWALAVSGWVIAIIPELFDTSIKFGSVGYIICAFALFTLALKNPGRSICRPLEYIGEKLSLFIYIIHVPLEGIFTPALALFLHVNVEGNLYLWVRPFVVAVITIGISSALSFVIKHRSS